MWRPRRDGERVFFFFIFFFLLLSFPYILSLFFTYSPRKGGPERKSIQPIEEKLCFWKILGLNPERNKASTIPPRATNPCPSTNKNAHPFLQLYIRNTQTLVEDSVVNQVEKRVTNKQERKTLATTSITYPLLYTVM